MKKEMKDLDAIIESVGIDAVMSHLKSSHADKVFIPNWYYQEHLEAMGFEFGQTTMWDFDEFMGDHGIYEVTTNSIQEDYPSMWEDFIEECYS